MVMVQYRNVEAICVVNIRRVIHSSLQLSFRTSFDSVNTERVTLKKYAKMHVGLHAKWSLKFSSFLPLGATAQGGLWSPEQSASIHPSKADYLVSEQFSFYGGGTR
jgi:hypothetical protein